MHAAEPDSSEGGGRDILAAAHLDEATAASVAATLQALATPSRLRILTTCTAEVPDTAYGTLPLHLARPLFAPGCVPELTAAQNRMRRPNPGLLLGLKGIYNGK